MQLDCCCGVQRKKLRLLVCTGGCGCVKVLDIPPHLSLKSLMCRLAVLCGGLDGKDGGIRLGEK